MKSILLQFFGILAFAAMVNAQTTYMDFENVSPIAYDFGGNTHEFMVDNPDASGNNTSDKVGMVVTGNETWSGDALPIGGTVDFSATDNTFSMDVYSDVTGEVMFKVEKMGDNSIASEVKAQYDEAGIWKTMEFVFPDDLEAGVYGQIVLFFNFGATEATTWYFDNVTGPPSTFASSTEVNFIVDDKLGQASDIMLNIAGQELELTGSDNIWTGSKELDPYNMIDGGGEYEIIVVADSENVDTTTLSITEGGGTLDWNYLLLNEEPEDGTLDCKYTTSPPEIDGEIDPIWDDVNLHPLQQREWWGSPTGLYSWFKMMWDDETLYILNYIEDNTLVNDAANPWENDNVELFFDMGREKANDGEGFDDNDYQIRYIWNDDTYTGSEGIDETWASSNGVTRAQTTLDNEERYVMEWAIPWDALAGITVFVPIGGSKFDFDVSVADNTGSGRAYIISWNTTADINYKNTSLYGTVTLSDEEVSTSVDLPVGALFNMYPNPVTDYMSISHNKLIKDVIITDMIGKEVMMINSDSQNPVVDLSKLGNGVYFIRITDESGADFTRKFLKQ